MFDGKHTRDKAHVAPFVSCLDLIPNSSTHNGLHPCVSPCLYPTWLEPMRIFEFLARPELPEAVMGTDVVSSCAVTTYDNMLLSS